MGVVNFVETVNASVVGNLVLQNSNIWRTLCRGLANLIGQFLVTNIVLESHGRPSNPTFDDLIAYLNGVNQADIETDLTLENLGKGLASVNDVAFLLGFFN